MKIAKKINEIELEEPNNHRPEGTNNSYQNGTLITIQGACENGLEEESNEDITEYFSEYGVVVKEAWLSTYKGSKQLNGNRSLVVELTPDLSIPRTVFYVGPHTEIKGKLKVFYKGQPYHCFKCDTTHERICPKKSRRKGKKEEERLDREVKNKTLIMSDSTLRMANQKAMNADIICISGGRIGHINNSMNYNPDILKYDNIVMVAGLNNIDLGDTPENERQHVFHQLKETGKSMKGQVKRNPKKKLFLVAPVPAPVKDATKIGDIMEMMRQMQTNGNKSIELIDTHFITSEKELYSDELHLNMTGTNVLIREINKGVENLMRKEVAVQDRIYAKVNTEYLCGCDYCCKENYQEEVCEVRQKLLRNSIAKRGAGELSSPENQRDNQRRRKAK